VLDWSVLEFVMGWLVLGVLKTASRTNVLRDKSLMTAKTTEEHERKYNQMGAEMFTFEAFSLDVIVRTCP
jgi:hypothetical protein